MNDSYADQDARLSVERLRTLLDQLEEHGPDETARQRGRDDRTFSDSYILGVLQTIARLAVDAFDHAYGDRDGGA